MSRFPKADLLIIKDYFPFFPPTEIETLERQLKKATSYEEWKRIALALDELKGSVSNSLQTF